jgi:multiple sugar transport system permease protein
MSVTTMPARPRGPRLARIAGRVAALALLVALSVLVLLPVGWMVTVALKPDQVPVFTAPPQWIPTQYFEFVNFVRTVTNPLRPFGLYILNTTVIFMGSVVGLLFSCSLAGYAFARMRFRWRTRLFWLLIVTMLIPWQVLIVPQFLLFHTVGWYGTYLPLIVPAFFGNAFYIFLIRQYMRTIPRELDEAARIDGAGHLRIFWSITCRCPSRSWPSSRCSPSSAAGTTSLARSSTSRTTPSTRSRWVSRMPSLARERIGTWSWRPTS